MTALPSNLFPPRTRRRTNANWHVFGCEMPVWTLNETEAEFSFEYLARRHPAEPDVGLFHDYWEVDGFQFGTCTIGALTLTWGDFVKLVDDAEAERIVGAAEDLLVERLGLGLEDPE